MKNTEFQKIQKMAGPVLLNYLLMSLFDVLDRAVVGRFSVQGFAVIGIAQAPLYEITGALGILSAAFSMMAAQRKGKQDSAGFESLFAVSLRLSMAVGAAFFLLCLAGGRFFFETIYQMEGAPLEELLSYFYPASFTVLQNMLLFLYAAYYRNRLNTRISLYSTAVSTLLNLFFDAVLVYGLLGFPCLGTAGAAWGSVIGLFAGLLVYQIPRRSKPRQKIQSLEKKQILKALLILYPPLFGQEFLENSLFVLAVSGVVARMGTREMAAYSLLASVENLVELPIYAYASAAQTYALQYRASGRLDKARRYLQAGQRMAFRLVFGLGVLCILFRSRLLGLLLADQAVLDCAGGMLVWMLAAAVSKVNHQFYLGYLQGTGREREVLVWEILSAGIASAAVLALGRLFALPGVYLVMAGKPLVLSLIFRRRISSEES